MLFSRKPPVTEKKVTLPNINWDKLETLLAELGNQRSVQITYDRGQLEMIEPHPERDRAQRLMESLLLVIADEAGDDLVNLGSVLLKQPQLAIAIQPDACYYEGTRVRPDQRAELDLSRQPAPHLIVDVQLEQAAAKRLGMFAALGIAEVWQYVAYPDDDRRNGELSLYQLATDRYQPSATSWLYPFLSATQITEFIQQSDTIGLAQALTVLRSWAKTAIV
jgi:Uma2 family endonuclease